MADDQGGTASGGTAMTGTAGSGTGEPKPLNPDPRVKELSDENARWRNKLRDTEKERDDLKAQLEASVATGGSNPALQRKVTELEGKVSDVEKKWKEANERANTETLKSAISQSLAGVKNIPYAMILVKDKAAIDEDGAPILNVSNDKGEPIKVPLTPENTRKYGVIAPEFLPPDGVGGTGFKPKGGEAGSGFDFNRCLADSAYFEEHRKEFWAAYPKHINKL